MRTEQTCWVSSNQPRISRKGCHCRYTILGLKWKHDSLIRYQSSFFFLCFNITGGKISSFILGFPVIVSVLKYKFKGKKTNHLPAKTRHKVSHQCKCSRNEPALQHIGNKSLLRPLCLQYYPLTFGSVYVSAKLPTYPFPKPTLTLSSYLGQNVGLGEG